MTRTRMAINIGKALKEEYNVELDREIILAILEIEETEVFKIIANEDKYNYSWGMIMGTEKKPARLAGNVMLFPGPLARGGWSAWKRGYPKVKWSQAALDCEHDSPQKFFEQDEYKYTSEARLFRQVNKLEEIPEYKNLPEEKIVELCEKADNINFSKLTRRQQRLKRRDDKYNAIQAKARVKVWEEIGHTPTEAFVVPEDVEQKDSVTIFMNYFKEHNQEFSIVDDLEWIRDMIDFAQGYHLWERNNNEEKLTKLEQEYIQKVKDANQKEIPHILKTPLCEYHIFHSEAGKIAMDYGEHRDYFDWIPKVKNHEEEIAKREELFNEILDKNIEQKLNNENKNNKE